MWRRLSFVCGVLLVVVCATPAAMAEQPTLSGRWSASAMHITWNIGDWGDACGPKPGGGGAPAGTVAIQQQGGELSISGAGRSYSTTRCWEQFPGLAVRSHSGGKRGWRTVCRTSSGDARQATVITTISASDSYITFDETGQYQFVISGQNCTASTRRSRSFRLIQREGEPPPAAATPAPAATPTAAETPTQPTPTPRPEPETATAPRAGCENPGPPARLEVRPSRKLMRPGEEFAFRSKVLDAQGCHLRSVAPTWRLADEKAPAKLIAPGKIRVSPDAGESELVLSASVGGRAVKVTVEVVSRERYDALLQQGGFNEAGESTEAAATAIASGSIGAGSAVAGDEGTTRKIIFVAVAGGLALLFGAVGLVLAVRNRKRRAEARRQAAARHVYSAPPPPVPAPAPPPRGTVCPTCRREYPPGTIFCPVDGNHVVPIEDQGAARGPAGGICPVCGQGFDPGIRVCPEHHEELVPAAVYLAQREAPAPVQKKICPVCGGQYEGDAEFCGEDGATLVPIN